MKFLLLLLSAFLLQSSSLPTVSHSSQLQHIQQRGELIAVTRYSPSTYYHGLNDHPTGLEYKLLERFASSLGVELRLIVADDVKAVFPLIVQGQADIAAAGLPAESHWQTQLRFAVPYENLEHYVICYRQMSNLPNKLESLSSQQPLQILQGAKQLERLQPLYPNLRWQQSEQQTYPELLDALPTKDFPCALIASTEFEQLRFFYPQISRRFTMPSVNVNGELQQLRWAVAREHEDISFYLAVVNFFQRLQQSGELQNLVALHHHTDERLRRLNKVDIRKFYQHLQQRLPHYHQWITEAAEQYGFEWELLAALAYQESHWNPQAVSPTGVKGLMMLTLETSEELGLEDRTDPKQSIFGGAAYLAKLYRRLPAEVNDPDRTWLAVAAYNLGYRHIKKALPEDPVWSATREQILPQRTDVEQYLKNRYGLRRGFEAITYVSNIQRYYTMLRAIPPQIADMDEATLYSEPREVLRGEQRLLQ